MSPKNRLLARLILLVVSVTLSRAARSQCPPQWSMEFPTGTIVGSVSALAVFDDDGLGPHAPALFIGGTFSAAFGTPAQALAKWDGTAGYPIASFQPPYSWGVPHVGRLQVLDPDGSGPATSALYVQGQFASIDGIPMSENSIARWNGTSWSEVGVWGDAIDALTVLDEDLDGPLAPAMFAGLKLPGTGAKYRVGRLVDDAWTLVSGEFDGSIQVLAVHDEDGAGPLTPTLYAAGSFTHVSGVAANRIAKWNGQTWQPLGLGFQQCGNCNPPQVYAMCAYDEDGAGPLPPALFVGGTSYIAGGQEIHYLARWDGQAWSQVGAGISGIVSRLMVFDDDVDGPNLPALFVSGNFDYGEPSPHLVKWDGHNWLPVWGGTSVYGPAALAAFDDDGDGPHPEALFVGGDFPHVANFPAHAFARWGLSGEAPVIAYQSGDLVASEGADVALYGEAFEMCETTYQWRRDGVPIPEGDDCYVIHGPALYLTGVVPSLAGTYDVVISNGCGTTTTLPMTLTVIPGPVIIAANPPLDNPYLPGQQPFRDVLQTGTTPAITQGIGGAGTPSLGGVNYQTITVTFDQPLPPVPQIWVAPANVVANISGANPYQIALSGPIPPGHTTVLVFPQASVGQVLMYESLPGDVSMNGTVSSGDLLELLGAMNSGAANLPQNLPRYDIDRSGSVSTTDLLRLVQLLNGINTSQAWNGATLNPPCT